MRILIISLALALLAGCAQNPVSGRNDFVMMSESQEVAVGRKNDEQIKKQYRVYESRALQEYVNRIGQKLAKQSHRPNLQYHFTVLDTPEINAFALPGGYVYITRGILAYLNSEAELAAVLGHEIGHVTARHGVRQQSVAQATDIGLTIASIFVPQLNSTVAQNLTNILGGALLSGYGREHELEADRLGADYLARSAYDPQAIIKVIGTLKDQETMDAELAKQEGREPRRYHGLFATHPDNDTRLQQAVGEAGKQTVAQPFAGRNEFLDAIEGMVFNDNSDQGVVRDNRFYHAELGMTLQFPATWQVHNLPDAVAAISPQGEAQVVMKPGGKANGTPVEFARRLAGYNAQIRSIEVNGLPAALIELPDSVGSVVFLNGQVFILQGKAKNQAQLPAWRERILATLNSFRALSAEERKQIKPLTIHVIPVWAGDRYAKLAQKSPLGQSAESYLRLMNAQYPSGEPQPGQRIKIVE
ncbi:MAG: peptidase M48 Ste24p [Gallionellales bacterium GWA2_60_18]|nr:MAG: peptidase M48 Ste24p [Gallionellales bacterium GWA2_60_18]